MRRAVLMLALMAATLVVASGVALAVNKVGTNGPDTLRGPTLTCGSGFDRVLADTQDLVAPDCERVDVGLAAAQQLNQQLEESEFFDRIFGGLAPFPGGWRLALKRQKRRASRERRSLYRGSAFPTWTLCTALYAPNVR